MRTHTVPSVCVHAQDKIHFYLHFTPKMSDAGIKPIDMTEVDTNQVQHAVVQIKV